MTSNFLISWGIFFPRQVYLQSEQNRSETNRQYIFELHHTDSHHATRVSMTQDVFDKAVTAYQNIMPELERRDISSFTASMPLYGIVSGFTTNVRVDMDLIGDMNDVRQSVMAYDLHIVPCTPIVPESIRVRRAARSDEMDMSNIPDVNLSNRFFFGRSNDVRHEQEPVSSRNEEHENGDEDYEHDHSSSDSDSSSSSTIGRAAVRNETAGHQLQIAPLRNATSVSRDQQRAQSTRVTRAASVASNDRDNSGNQNVTPVNDVPVRKERMADKRARRKEINKPTPEMRKTKSNMSLTALAQGSTSKKIMPESSDEESDGSSVQSTISRLTRDSSVGSFTSRINHMAIFGDDDDDEEEIFKPTQKRKRVSRKGKEKSKQ